ncbi:class I SAM-dependent methyltransferase [Solemya velesiana gill symbiont]|uniref:SAM-dependent methyltransferase n=1 Tax=Solemya velesiana gill symbiont TaxID=1918948 RepID=A0A1T2KUV8_9GAMM|nr:methyltransferase domain-containing protein [Solemya velesiana gill symbiont]OOZ36614.1 SAM-dependent methyltransferase [Solemya velesiana gill symbiont]
MGEHLKEKWDRRYAAAEGTGDIAWVLEENRHLLPSHGEALDLASGLGANALARAGLQVSAWDISPVAIDRLREIAEKQGVSLSAEVRDVIASPPEPASFDLILVSHFLGRSLMPAITSALRKGGLLFYQTFTRTSVTDEGPSNPDFRLADNELLNLFGELKIRVYREEGVLGDTSKGWRDRAMLVAEKTV